MLLSACALACADSRPVTFSKDVLPILQKHCQVCHRPGEAAPMALLDYQNTRPWAKSIKAAVLNRKMPPWSADPRYGHFRNDRRLPDADIQTLAAWVDGGALEGNPADQPAPLHWTDGWNIRPDVVFELPKPYVVPATGTIPWLDFVIPTHFTKDTWVKAGEVRPGARSVLHHVSVSFIPPGPLARELENAPPGEPVKLPRGVDNEFFLGFAPGTEPGRFDVDDSAVLIPAGSYLILNMHFTTNGKVTADQTKVGLELATEPPRNRYLQLPRGGDDGGISPINLTILPGDANSPAHNSVTFEQPVKLAFLRPHMHLRGKDFRATATYPTSETETLLSVPRYDYNWQLGYIFEKPLVLPAGTRLDIYGHWDNSAANPSNPDPAATVHWGQQAWDEMFGGGVAVIIPRDVDPKTLLRKSKKPANVTASAN